MKSKSKSFFWKNTKDTKLLTSLIRNFNKIKKFNGVVYFSDFLRLRIVLYLQKESIRIDKYWIYQICLKRSLLKLFKVATLIFYLVI